MILRRYRRRYDVIYVPVIPSTEVYEGTFEGTFVPDSRYLPGRYQVGTFEGNMVPNIFVCDLISKTAQNIAGGIFFAIESFPRCLLFARKDKIKSRPTMSIDLQGGAMTYDFLYSNFAKLK